MIKLSCYPPHAFEWHRDEFEAIADAGYDCTEFSLEILTKMSETEFAEFKSFLQDRNLKIDALDNPFPNKQSVLDDTFSLEAYKEVLKLEFNRAAELGCRRIVYGQRVNRVLPGEYRPIQHLREKLVDGIRVGAQLAAAEGMQFLIEICGRNATNFINTFAEAKGMIEEIGEPNISSMCDIRHMLNSGEPYENMIRYKDMIKLVHIDMPYTDFPVRKFPALNDGFDYDPFFHALKIMEYDGAISVEARTYNDFASEIKEGLGFFAHYGMFPAKSGKA